MTESDLLNEMMHERHDLRIELIEMEKSMHRSALLLVTLTLGLLGIESGALTAPGKVPYAYLFVAVAQVEYFVGLFFLSLVANQNVHGGYIRALETRINILFGTKVSLWESEAAPSFLFHPRGSFCSIVLLLWSFALLFYVYTLIRAYNFVNAFWFGVGVVEVGVMFALGIWAILDTHRVYSRMTKLLGQKFPS